MPELSPPGRARPRSRAPKRNFTVSICEKPTCLSPSVVVSPGSQRGVEWAATKATSPAQIQSQPTDVRSLSHTSNPCLPPSDTTGNFHLPLGALGGGHGPSYGLQPELTSGFWRLHMEQKNIGPFFIPCRKLDLKVNHKSKCKYWLEEKYRTLRKHRHKSL